MAKAKTPTKTRVTKAGLIDMIAAKADISKAEAKRVLDAVIDTISESLAKGDAVTLTGFGTFETRKYKARNGVNPQTGKKIKIPATKRPAFRAGALLKRQVS